MRNSSDWIALRTMVPCMVWNMQTIIISEKKNSVPHVCCTWVMTSFESHTILTHILSVCTISINMLPFTLHMSAIYRSNNLGDGNNRGKNNVLFHFIHTRCMGNGTCAHPTGHGIPNLGHHSGKTALGEDGWITAVEWSRHEQVQSCENSGPWSLWLHSIQPSGCHRFIFSCFNVFALSRSS